MKQVYKNFLLIILTCLSGCFFFTGKIHSEELLHEEDITINEIDEGEEIVLTKASINSTSIIINEIYAAPNTSLGEQEWVEIYIEQPSLIDTQNLYILDETQLNRKINGESYTKKYFGENTSQSNYLLLNLGTSFLNNTGGDLISLLDNDSGETIQTICYGNVSESIAPICDYTIILPEKEKSLSYIKELDNYKITQPTPEAQNTFIQLDFSLIDQDYETKTNFLRGETISIIEEIDVYGLANPHITWYLNDEEITDLDFNTDELVLGEHIIKVTSMGLSVEKYFSIIENYEGLEISEVFPNPKGEDIIGVNEWLELHNTSNREIYLKGLNLERITDSQIYKHIVEDDIKIAPEGYFVIYPKFALTNENCSLRITNGVDIITSFSYNEKVGEEESVIYYDNEIKITLTPTKGSRNIYNSKYIENDNEDKKENDEEIILDFSDLEISEIFPNPEGTDLKGVNEWIELYNKGNYQINVKGLVIVQMTSTNYRYLIDTDLFINPNAYLQIFLPYSINNTNAIFQLQNQPETIFDEVFYDNAVKEGQSLIRSDGSNELQPVSIPTPGEVNIISGQVLSAEDNVLMTITQSKTLDPKTQVSIKGTITVDVGLLGNNIFYIQDETGGIQILLEEYNSNIIQKDIIIEAQGEIAIYHKETRLKVKTENINLINQSIVIQPQTLNIVDINEDLIGSLLKIKGNVIKTSGNIFYIQDKTGTLRVQIKDTTNIIRPDCRKGYYAEIVGILSVWDTTAEGGLNYRLLPRYQEDVYISKTLANTGGKKTTLLILLGFISLIFSSTRICKINEIQI